MDTLNAITGGYKKQFIEDIIEGMTPFCDNNQLLELNKSLNYQYLPIPLRNAGVWK